MNSETISLIILNVILTATGQILLKPGMVSVPVQSALVRGRWSIGPAVALQPMIWAGRVAYGGSLLLWLALLARAPASSAYHFVALSIALASVTSIMVFNDTVSYSKIIGSALILGGVIALSRS